MTITDHPGAAQSATLADPRVVSTQMTLDEFLALPDEETSLEFDAGVVRRKVAPQADHGSLQFEFAKHLDGASADGRHGRVFTETRFVTPGWSPVPDVSFYRRGRIKARSATRIGDFHLPPDIAVEIVSPDQSVSELLRKCVRYADLGVAISLVVDIDDESIFVVRPDQPLRVLRGDDRIDLDDVLPAVTLTVHQLFASLVTRWMIDDGDGDAHPDAPAEP
jgi:Uma2 family endonuclease